MRHDLENQNTKKNLLAAAALLALVFLAFWPALRDGFIWDDDLLLTENALIKAPDGLRYLWFSTAPIDYFPLTYSDFWLEWRLWGMNAAGYHFTNMLLHGINAILLWRVLLRLRLPGAFFGAALFALHPVNVATVAWIAERKNTVSMVFFLLSILFYLRSDEEKNSDRKFYALALGSFALSLLSKTAVVMLPFILLGLRWWRRGLTRRDLWRSVPFFAVSFIMGLITIWFQYHRALEDDFPHRSFLARLPYTGRAAWFYLEKAFVPVRLSPVYPEWTIDYRSFVAYLPGILLLVMLGVFWAFRKTWSKSLLLVLGGFLLALFPVLGFLEVNYEQFSWVADHWQYFALPFITALVAAVIVWRLGVRMGASILSVVLVFFGILTWRESRVYSADRIWRESIRMNERCWVAYNNLGQMLVEQGDYEGALKLFDLALKYRPGFHYGLLGRSSTLLRMNRLPEAIEPLQEIARIDPHDLHNHFNLGTVYLETSQPKLAIVEYELALNLPPEKVAGHSIGSPEAGGNNDDKLLRSDISRKLGFAELMVGDKAAAMKSFLKSLEWKPSSAEAHYQVALLFDGQHDKASARQHLREAIRLKPDMLEALNNLAWALATDEHASSSDKIDALQFGTHAAELTGFKNEGVLDTLAAVEAQNGRFEEAVRHAEQAQNWATEKGLKSFAAELQQRLELYRQKKPYHE